MTRPRANFTLGSVFVVSLIALAFLSGCSATVSSPGGGTVPAAIAVSLSLTTASVQVSTTQQFMATVANDSANKGVSWALSGAGCSGAACGTLSAASSGSGVAITYTAPVSVPNPATVTLTATAMADTSKTATTTITVTAAPPAIAVSLSLTTAGVQVASTQAFTANVANDSANKGVTWALSGGGCSGATCGTLSASSSASEAAITYAAPASVPNPATVTLTATSVADTTKSASATITVTAAPLAIAVTVSPTTGNVQVSTPLQFIATVANDSSNKGVTWALSGGGCTGNACGTLSATSSASGIAITYTAPASVPNPATVTLTATSVADATKSASATITVTAAPAISVTLSQSTANVQEAATQGFTATLANDTTNKGVNWTISGTGCTGTGNPCGTVNPTSSVSGANVTYTAPSSVPSSTATLTATSVADGSKSASATITITVVSGVGVTLTPKRGGIPVSQTLNFAATVANDVGTDGVTWTASGSSCTGNACGTFTVGTPSTTATYTAPATPGVYTITATSVADGTKSASATIGVTDLAGMTTYHNDLSRDGVNGQEYALTTSNVANATFGKLFSCTVDGAIYAQPLWVPGLTVNGAKHNVIFVATQHDSLYAIDADASPCTTLWHVSLIDTSHGGASGETSVPSSPGNSIGLGQGFGDIIPEVGVTGTPVIDASTSTLYVVSKSLASGSTVVQRLHAIDLATGSEKFAGPVAISATVPGSAPDASSNVVTFNSRDQNQRPALALVNGVVYIGWSAHEDGNAWHGWLMGYAVTGGTLGQVAVFNSTPNTVSGASYARGGIWMSGGAPAADSSNNLFLITGNGTFDGATNFSDSLLKLSTSAKSTSPNVSQLCSAGTSSGSGFCVADWFTPSDQATLDMNDMDFGSGGAVVLLNTGTQHLAIGGGKEGNIFVLNRDNLGGFNSSTNQVVQTFAINGNATIYSTPTYWNNALFVASATQGGAAMPLQCYSFSVGATPPFSPCGSPGSPSTTTKFNFPAPTVSVSASGTTNGIVWALDNTNYCTAQSTGCGPTVLHAYDATNLGMELWNSATVGAGLAVKFTVPTVANGKVYVGTRGTDGTPGAGGANSNSEPGGTGELDVYGLLPN